MTRRFTTPSGRFQRERYPGTSTLQEYLKRALVGTRWQHSSIVGQKDGTDVSSVHYGSLINEIKDAGDRRYAHFDDFARFGLLRSTGGTDRP